MKTRTFITLGIVSTCVWLATVGCQKKDAELDVSQYHTAEGTLKQIQNLKPRLTEALARKDLQFVHDFMYYLQDLCAALSSKLEGDRKQRVDAVLKELMRVAEEIDNSAGRQDQAATEANLQKLHDTLKELETQFKGGQK